MRFHVSSIESNGESDFYVMSIGAALNLNSEGIEAKELNENTFYESV
ncbi:hypothetical protein [Leptospira interrogans]|nr:hypothetical protein [Leptospira interrogans]